MQLGPQGGVQTVGQEGDEDMRLDPIGALVVDGGEESEVLKGHSVPTGPGGPVVDNLLLRPCSLHKVCNGPERTHAERIRGRQYPTQYTMAPLDPGSWIRRKAGRNVGQVRPGRNASGGESRFPTCAPGGQLSADNRWRVVAVTGGRLESDNFAPISGV